MAKATDPIVIGKRTAKNRVTMAPTVKFIAGEDGKVTEDFVAHYAERAKHECAFICVEATCITPEGRLAPSQLGLWEDGQIEGHKRLTDACHEYGALVVPQIHHGGVAPILPAVRRWAPAPWSGRASGESRRSRN